MQSKRSWNRGPVGKTLSFVIGGQGRLAFTDIVGQRECEMHDVEAN